MKGETMKKMLPVQLRVESPMQVFMMSRCLARQAVPDGTGVCTVASCKDSQALATSHADRGEWPSLIRTHPLLHMMLPLPISLQILRFPFCVQFCVFSS